MIILRKMQQEEYLAFSDYFIDDYSREMVANYGHSLDFAIGLAKKDLDSSFSMGLANSCHTLLCIEAETEGQPDLVGYLWHAINANDQSTFIYDFYVFDEYRSRGYGRQAIAELEKQLLAVGVNQIKLRVAYYNERALKLYQEVGFVITGINMSKTLQNL